MRLQVKAGEGVVVVLPAGECLSRAEAFLYSNRDWILKQAQKVSQKQARQTLFIPGLYYSTLSHRLYIYQEEREDMHSRVANGKMEVRFPLWMKPEDPRLQELVRKIIRYVLREEAMQILPRRTRELAGQFGLEVARVSVRDNRSRWGSCAANGNISLNIHLVRLPEDLRDYIILHELAHTVHRNHGPGFHALLEQMFPGHRQAERRIREYSPSIF